MYMSINIIIDCDEEMEHVLEIALQKAWPLDDSLISIYTDLHLIDLNLYILHLFIN